MKNKTTFLSSIKQTLRKIPGGFHFTRDTIKSIGKRKVFCIGHNKTGTTSMYIAFKELGLFASDFQSFGERLLYDWVKRDFRKLFYLCLTAQAFQDAPFSYPFTFQALDQRFPGSKFILTVRDNPEQWYQSLVRYKSINYGHKNIPTRDDLRKATYLWKGYEDERNRFLYNTPMNDPYNKEKLINFYNFHNESIINYFKHREKALLVLNVASEDAYDKLCDFLELPRVDKRFPHANKTPEI